jgi:hypothetical protein
MKQQFVLLSLGIGALLLATQHAFAQSPAQSSQNCAARASVLQQLSERYGETRQSIGLGGNDALVELFASRATGTWTITVTLPSGTTCVVAAGDAFETVADAPLPKGDGA